MKLEERLGKIATGMSVSDAIDSYMDELEAKGTPVSDPAAEADAELMAIVEVMFHMAAVDGEVSEEEVRELRASLQAIRDMNAMGGGFELDAVMKDLSGKLAEEGWKQRLEKAAARIRAPEARSFAFQLAASVAFVDDFVAHAEAAAIDSLAQAFGFEKEESQDLLREVHENLFADPRRA
ncbi:MAG: TerB family tellurite resistance protein [Sandaracinaceae bacterium]